MDQSDRGYVRYRVEGAYSATGRDRWLVIEAGSQAAAEEIAQQQGMLISTIYQVPSESLQDPLQQLAAATAPPPRQPPPQSTSYRSAASGIAVQVSHYEGLRFAAFAFHIFALLSYVGGGLVIVMSVIASSASIRLGSGPGAILGMLSRMILSLWPFAVGVTFHAAAPMCDAIRDKALHGSAAG